MIRFSPIRSSNTAFQRLFAALLPALAWLAVLAPAAEAAKPYRYGPGFAELTITDQRNDRPLAGHIWYPTSTPQTFTQTDKSKVWLMPESDQDGPAADGTFPLVIVSHGMYGNTFNQAWLGSALSRRGYVVAMINHPGTSSFLRDPDQARQLWERPTDLSRIITYLLETPSYRNRIDRKRIYAAGHSLGGMTVMMLGGAAYDPKTREAQCTGKPQPVVCKVLDGWSVAESSHDRHEMETSRKDSRVRKVISLDLGGTPVFSGSSLAAYDIPVLVLGSGRADMIKQEYESAALAAALPAGLVHHSELEDAGHFDFMGRCKPDGFGILKQEEPGDEIVCIKGTGDRARQHQRIIGKILSFLEE